MRALRTTLGLLLMGATLSGCIIYSEGPDYRPYRGYYASPGYGYDGPGYGRPYRCYRCW